MTTEVVASAMVRDAASARRAIERAEASGADWVEFRLDAWDGRDDLAPVIEATELPVLGTCRVERDGGTFDGTPAERRERLSAVLRAGARGVDLELWETWEPEVRPELVVRSHHDLNGVPDDLSALRDRLLAMGADVAKIVVTPGDLADAAPVMALLRDTDQDETPTVAFGMGEAAAATRVIGAVFGSPMVYASIDDASATAAGQWTVEELVERFAVHHIGADTALFGVLGLPARHSIGPIVHNRFFQAHEIDAVYLPLETARPDEVLAMLRPELAGVSVTAPHKEWATRVTGIFDSEAAVGCVAVNTLTFYPDGTVAGFNTDIEGVQGALTRAGIGPAAEPGQAAAVLGGGGAARAAAWALQGMGFEVSVLARTAGKPLVAAAETWGWRVEPMTAEVLRDLAPRVVVHATPVGGVGRPDEGDRLLPEWEPAVEAVLDMVYRPRDTRLLRDARAAGAVAIPGEEMFLTQAVAQLAEFVGRRPEEDELRRWLP